MAIVWRIVGAQTTERLVLEWTETGTPAGSPPPKPGCGRELIEQSLPYSLNAQTSFELTPHGPHCRIELPLVTAPYTPQ